MTQPLSHLPLLPLLPSPMSDQTPSATTTTTSTSASAATCTEIVPVPVTASATPSTTSSSSSKIPFRPRKIRKLSPSSEESKPSSADATKILAVNYLPRPLSSDGELAAAIRHLRAADPVLAGVIDSQEPPVFQSLDPPFHALVRSILYQQLAFKAANSIYTRFLALCGGEHRVSPDAVLGLSAHQLRQIGVSARKASYLHDLARKYHAGILSDPAIVAMDDRSLFAMLTMVKGIGAWSVHMFMIFHLHRPDVLPVCDLGFRKGVQILYGIDDVPRPSQMEALCERWRPYRSVGAWYVWRLADPKGSASNIAAVSAGGAASALPGGGAVGMQAQLIDPIQMLPNLG